MTHSRPATRPMPVIRPAARMASSYMSSAASGDNSRNGVPASISVMTRSRGRSLPRARWRSRERGGPPSAAAARRVCNSVTSALIAAWLARNSGDVVSIADLIAVTSPSSMWRPFARRQDQTYQQTAPPQKHRGRPAGRPRLFSAVARRPALGADFLPLEDYISDDKQEDRAGDHADGLRPHDLDALQQRQRRARYGAGLHQGQAQ